MKSSLIPEKPILVYPSLAATVGLDETVMLSVLSELASTAESRDANGFHWYQLSVERLEQALPFWDKRDLQRVSTSLREKGIILIGSAPLLQDAQFKFAFNERTENTQANPQASAKVSTDVCGFSGKNFIPPNWQPDQLALDQLAQLNIPADFARRQVPEFVTYWRERNEAHRSWGQKFISHTIQRWRNFEAQENRRTRAHPISSQWSPTQNSIKDLVTRGIPRQFVMDQIREFVTFWQAAGESHISWDNKFILRVNSLWAELESKKNISTGKFPIFNNWRPSADAIEVMTERSDIPLSFVEDAIPEFVIYWKDKGITSNTWNSLFIKHVRLQWHRYQHALDNSVDPQPIQPNWQPAAEVYDILHLANIDADFARELIPEFVLYWKDRNEIHRSWNSRFLHHVKRTWAARHQLGTPGDSQMVRSTRDISLEEELNDTSWAR